MQKPFRQSLKEGFKLYLIFGKRLIDILFSLIALITLLPLMLIISILIKIFDPGPIIFRQKRIGLNLKLFNIYKFRSMPVDTINIPSAKIKNINLSWVGQLIRRTNLDELPQIINILKGDMSIVGPRPAIKSQLTLIKYRKKEGIFFYRPGLTGLAQISSFDGMRDEIKTKYDTEYIKSISLKNDMIIILKTCAYLLKPPPIY